VQKITFTCKPFIAVLISTDIILLFLMKNLLTNERFQQPFKNITILKGYFRVEYRNEGQKWIGNYVVKFDPFIIFFG